MKLIFLGVFLLPSVLLLSACGLPINQMTSAEREADMSWAFTLFEHNYAPDEFKKSHFGIELSELKESCITQAKEEMSNQEFLALFQKCIHSVKDPHVAAQQLNNGLLPEFAEVAHLGFTTLRTKIEIDGVLKESLRIASPLKGSEGAGAPLIAGDIIYSVNNGPVDEYLRENIVPYIDAGQDETNLSAAAIRFAIRTSNDMALPEEDEITLSILRGSKKFEIILPWIKEDLLDFQLKQAPPEEPDKNEEKESLPNPVSTLALNPLAYSFFGYHQIKEFFSFLDKPIEALTDRVQWILKTGFRVTKFNPILHSLLKGDLESNQGLDQILRNRILPLSVNVTDLMDQPLFNAKMVTTDDGKVYAYIQLTSFPAEDKILVEWVRAIRAIEDKQIKSVVIDLIDNGGGSLVHGMRILNMIRQKQIQFPSLKVKLNNNWYNSFKTQAAFGIDDYAKTIATRIVRDMNADQAAGQNLSRPISVRVLDPFFLQNPFIGLQDDVKIALLVNEFCVSMCDIFASVFQDNQMGVVIGQQTMGGGGNVVQHGLSPISKMGLSLTESMVLSPNGKIIENFGVTPDVAIDMVAGRNNGFSEAFEAAYKFIFE